MGERGLVGVRRGGTTRRPRSRIRRQNAQWIGVGGGLHVCGELVEHRCQGRLAYMPDLVLYHAGQLIPRLPQLPTSRRGTHPPPPSTRSARTEPIGAEHPGGNIGAYGQLGST
jgi:hypothetical protein